MNPPLICSTCRETTESLDGNISQCVSSTPIPGAVFRPDAFPFLLRMDTLQISQMFSLNVENVSDVAVTLTGCVFGRTV